MPQIIVTAGSRGHPDEVVMTLRERINPADFDSDHFAAQLVERLGWAVCDAVEVESEIPADEPRRARERTAERSAPGAPHETGAQGQTADRDHGDDDEEPELDPIWAAPALS